MQMLGKYLWKELMNDCTSMLSFKLIRSIANLEIAKQDEIKKKKKSNLSFSAIFCRSIFHDFFKSTNISLWSSLTLREDTNSFSGM